MKVFIHYEEPAAASLHQTLKITLPKKWEKGPCKNLIDTFVKNYNDKHPENALDAMQLRMETDMREAVPFHAIVCERVHDRADLYVKFGASSAPPQRTGGASAGVVSGGNELDRERLCTNFGCNTKYCERANHDGACRHHTKPPVFHETAKYWSCCPHKKAYDWESFMEIKGCAHGMHTDLKQGGPSHLGGAELREARNGGPKLKSVEEFNRQRAGEPAEGAADETPLALLKRALISVGCSASDFEAAVAALRKKFADDEKEVLAELATEFGFGLHNLIGTTGSGPPPPPS